MKSLTVFFPAYNDAMTIGGLIRDTVVLLDPLGMEYEILIIEDGSQDNTLEVVLGLEKEFQQVRVIRHEIRQGYGGVLNSGFKHATKEWVFYTDGDGQYDVRDLPALWPYCDAYDFINGYIKQRQDPPGRIWISWCYHCLLFLFFGKTLKYVNCDFRLIKKNIMEDVLLSSRGGFAPAELVIRLLRKGIHVKEVPVKHYKRKYGRSQFLNVSELRHVVMDFVAFLRTKGSDCERNKGKEL